MFASGRNAAATQYHVLHDGRQMATPASLMKRQLVIQLVVDEVKSLTRFLGDGVRRGWAGLMSDASIAVKHLCVACDVVCLNYSSCLAAFSSRVPSGQAFAKTHHGFQPGPIDPLWGLPGCMCTHKHGMQFSAAQQSAWCALRRSGEMSDVHVVIVHNHVV